MVWLSLGAKDSKPFSRSLAVAAVMRSTSVWYAARRPSSQTSASARPRAEILRRCSSNSSLGTEPPFNTHAKARDNLTCSGAASFPLPRDRVSAVIFALVVASMRSNL